MTNAIDYLHPAVPDPLPWVDVPLVRATSSTLSGYGTLVANPDEVEIEVATWPASGWRPIDEGTGNEAGTTSGTFEFWWEGNVLYGANKAVNDRYVLGWADNPSTAPISEAPTQRHRVLLWHANYHPDGGQLFFPLDTMSFIAPLALPGDDVSPENFTAFYVDAGQGLYIHPNVWHEGVFPLTDRARFYDEQGKVHARVSCNIAQEFGVFLAVRYEPPSAGGRATHGTDRQLGTRGCRTSACKGDLRPARRPGRSLIVPGRPAGSPLGRRPRSRILITALDDQAHGENRIPDLHHVVKRFQARTAQRKSGGGSCPGQPIDRCPYFCVLVRIRAVDTHPDHQHTDVDHGPHGLEAVSAEHGIVVRHTRPREAIVGAPDGGVDVASRSIFSNRDQPVSDGVNCSHDLIAVASEDLLVVGDSMPGQRIGRSPHGGVRIRTRPIKADRHQTG